MGLVIHCHICYVSRMEDKPLEVVDRRSSQIEESLEMPDVVEGLPPGWREFKRKLDGVMYVNEKRRLAIIISEALEGDGRVWRHASISHPKRMPNYEELMLLRRYAFGDVECYQVFPKLEKHVNIHPTCLHLWGCKEGQVLPDFSRGTGSI